MKKKASLPLRRLGICSGILGISLLSLPINPAYAGRYNASNATGTNTSNATGTNTSNATGGKNSSRYGLSGNRLRLIVRASKLVSQLRAAQASGNQAEIQQISQQARQLLRSIQLNRYRSNFSRQTW